MASSYHKELSAYRLQQIWTRWLHFAKDIFTWVFSDLRYFTFFFQIPLKLYLNHTTENSSANGTCNGLVLSGNKPWPQLVFDQTLWSYMVWLGHNELRYIVQPLLTYWGGVTHISISKLTIIGSDNGLSPDRLQAIIWTNDGLLLIGPLGTNFSEILIEIITLSFKKMHLKVSSAKWQPFCLCLNVLNVTEWVVLHCPDHCLSKATRIGQAPIIYCYKQYIDGLVQDCSISNALAIEILQSCNKPSMYTLVLWEW